ncbi:hypothetical protein ACQPW1_24560 [Nocardia sp. CA-128927]
MERFENKEKTPKSETPPPVKPRSEQTDRALGKAAIDAVNKK